MVLSHEVDELYNDPFVQNGGIAVSPRVDGSVCFAQANLETGDVIEGMAAADVIYSDTLNTTGGPYLYSFEKVANLEWFTRSPVNGRIYSWPNEHHSVRLRTFPAVARMDRLGPTVTARADSTSATATPAGKTLQ